MGKIAILSSGFYLLKSGSTTDECAISGKIGLVTHIQLRCHLHPNSNNSDKIWHTHQQVDLILIKPGSVTCECANERDRLD